MKILSRVFTRSNNKIDKKADVMKNVWSSYMKTWENIDYIYTMPESRYIYINHF